MDDNADNSVVQEVQEVPSSPGGEAEQQPRRRRINYKRPRRLYNESDDHSDSDDDAPSPKQAKSEGKDRYDSLQKQIEELKYLMTRNYNPPSTSTARDTDPSKEDDSFSFFSEAFQHVPENKEFEDYSFTEYDTTLVGNILPKTADSRLKEFERLQHFGSSHWVDVRYAEVQKKYLTIPTGTNLEVNDEFIPFDNKQHVMLKSLDQTFAALTNMLLIQRETIQGAIKDLLSWCNDKNTHLTPASATAKLREVFADDSKLKTVSKDLIQVVCGRRADIIQQRRDKLLANVKDKFNKTVLRKVPPSCEHLFQASPLADTITKMGGCSKVFYRKPFTPAEGNQSTQNRYYDPVVNKPFHGSAPSRSQQRPDTSKGKSLAGKRPFAGAKNKSYKSRRDDYNDRRRKH